MGALKQVKEDLEHPSHNSLKREKKEPRQKDRRPTATQQRDPDIHPGPPAPIHKKDPGEHSVGHPAPPPVKAYQKKLQGPK